jgi:hypothetical protein
VDDKRDYYGEMRRKERWRREMILRKKVCKMAVMITE